MIAVAWDGRMGVVHEARRDSSSGRVKMGRAPPVGFLDEAADVLWTVLSVRGWESFVLERGWPTSR